MKKNIFFVVPSLIGGGAEKIVAILLNNLDRRQSRFSLVLFEKKGVYLNEIPHDISIYDLKKKNRFSLLKLIFKLSQIIKREEPDVVISFLEYANLVCLLTRVICQNQTKWCSNERSLLLTSLRNNRMYFLKLILHKLLDGSADLVITNSKSSRAELVKNFYVPENKISVIHNPIETKKIENLSKQIPTHPWYAEKVPIIISVGRLTRAKGYLYLLKAFSKVLREVECRLIILGEGEMRSELERLINELGIRKNVDLPGFISDPYSYLSKAETFVLSSLWEGLPNALLEAMACGLPVISTCYSSGSHEIITDGVDGLLVPTRDINALARAILRLLKDEPLRKRLAKVGRKRAEDFKVKKIVREYERMFEKIIEE